MTDVMVFVEEDKKSGENRIVSISCVGHANYAETGKDILCAATSMAMHILESGIRQQMGIPCVVRTDHNKGEWEVEWNIKDAVRAAPFAEVVADALGNLASEYPDHIKFSEEEML
ncbi:MAG: ribosomal-processing cysteine protease Prp [Spirochaetia bacterium]|nr:ribosomal-processing cysteine protease Prp [Spirochaetia bacterium]